MSLVALSFTVVACKQNSSPDRRNQVSGAIEVVTKSTQPKPSATPASPEKTQVDEQVLGLPTKVEDGNPEPLNADTPTDLKNEICSFVNTLKIPNPNSGRFAIETDASEKGAGSVLL